ncbi:MAG: pentapeptide repeat-containing protein [Proteobacteria bacterium]|nr:pentapeptide repeat-containing protein [Pseudomonadota bacterium]
MPCVLAYKHEWCSKVKPLIKASDGNRYCVYHAPRGEKDGLGAEEFNARIFTRISYSMQNEAEANLSGTIFEGDFSFKDLGPESGPDTEHPHCSIDFSDATFTGNADFASVQFASKVSFKRAIFCKRADFSGAIFNDTARFDYAIFNEESDFTGAFFKEQAHFFDANFLAKADFRTATFSKEVYFTLGAFKTGAVFTDAKYGARAVFKRPYAGIDKGGSKNVHLSDPEET